MEFLLDLDQNLSLAVNGFHFPWLDPVMIFWSRKLVWIPLYALVVWKLFRQHGKRDFSALLVLMVFAIVLSDQTASAVFKPFFERLRPCHEPALSGGLHLPDGCGGQFGFASSHAANSFGFAVMVFLFRGTSIRSTWYLFVWAAVTGWSRIYLGAHYLGDVLAGFAIGGGWACLSYWIFSQRPWKTLNP